MRGRVFQVERSGSFAVLEEKSFTRSSCKLRRAWQGSHGPSSRYRWCWAQSRERKQRRTMKSPTEMVPERRRLSRLLCFGIPEGKTRGQRRLRLAVKRLLMAHWRRTPDVCRASDRGFRSATAMNWGGGNCDTTQAPFIPGGNRRRFRQRRRFTRRG